MPCSEKLLTKNWWVGRKITQSKEEAVILPGVKTLFISVDLFRSTHI